MKRKFNLKIGKERENTCRKNKEISGWKPQIKHTEASLKHIDDHICLSRSEESKRMLTHGKDGIVRWRRLYHVFTYISSLMIDKDICDRRNVSIKLPCVCVCFSSGDLFIFIGKSFLFFPYFCYTYFGTFLSKKMNLYRQWIKHNVVQEEDIDKL